jgi:ferredoxin
VVISDEFPICKHMVSFSHGLPSLTSPTPQKLLNLRDISETIPMRVLAILSLTIAVAQGFLAPATPYVPSPSVALRSAAPLRMQLFGGMFGGKKDQGGGAAAPQNSRDADFARRQAKLQERQAKAATQPKGTVECTFPQKGNKVVLAQQGEPLGKVIGRAGLRVKFDCKNGRCGTCQVRLNGRAAAKICQGATVPGGATRKLKIELDN